MTQAPNWLEKTESKDEQRIPEGCSKDEPQNDHVLHDDFFGPVRLLFSASRLIVSPSRCNDGEALLALN